MIILVITIVATLGSIGLTLLVFGANMMSDAPSQGFQGGSVLLAAWIVTGLCWIWWVYQ